MLVQCQMSDDSTELLQHLARSLSVLDAVPPHPWQHFFTRRAQRSAASARPPPPLLDGAASELLSRRATDGGRPGASSTQAGARPSLQRDVDPRRRADPKTTSFTHACSRPSRYCSSLRRTWPSSTRSTRPTQPSVSGLRRASRGDRPAGTTIAAHPARRRPRRALRPLHWFLR